MSLFSPPKPIKSCPSITVILEDLAFWCRVKNIEMPTILFANLKNYMSTVVEIDYHNCMPSSFYAGIAMDYKRKPIITPFDKFLDEELGV